MSGSEGQKLKQYPRQSTGLSPKLRILIAAGSFLLLALPQSTPLFADDEASSRPLELAKREAIVAPAESATVPDSKVQAQPAWFRVLAPEVPREFVGGPPRRYSTTTIQVRRPPESPCATSVWPLVDSLDAFCSRERPIDCFDPDGSADGDGSTDHGHARAGLNLVRRPAVPIDPKVAGASRLARKLAWRQVRRFFRSDLRDRYKSDFTMDYYAYLSERDDIGRLGRDSGGLVGEDFELQKARQSVLRSTDDHNVERDITLVDWGPIQLNDSGQLRVDVSKLRREPAAQNLTIAPDLDPDQPAGESLFRGRLVRLNTDVKLRPDVSALIEGDGYRAVLGEVGASVKVDFFSAILQQRYMTAELETSIDEDGDTGLFVNFTLYAR